jgi:hypothetical protein
MPVSSRGSRPCCLPEIRSGTPRALAIFALYLRTNHPRLVHFPHSPTPLFQCSPHHPSPTTSPPPPPARAPATTRRNQGWSRRATTRRRSRRGRRSPNPHCARVYARGSMVGGGGRRAALGRWCLVILAVASALGVSGPAFYWRYKKGFSSSSPSSTAAAVASSPSCPPCSCDCPAPLSLKSIAPGDLSCSDPLSRSSYSSRLISVGTHVYP